MSFDPTANPSNPPPDPPQPCSEVEEVNLIASDGKASRLIDEPQRDDL